MPARIDAREDRCPRGSLTARITDKCLCARGQRVTLVGPCVAGYGYGIRGCCKKTRLYFAASKVCFASAVKPSGRKRTEFEVLVTSSYTTAVFKHSLVPRLQKDWERA